MLKQRTLRESIKSTGVGLHSGSKVVMMLSPAPADTGIVFRRSDLSPVQDIPARADWVNETSLSTNLGRWRPAKSPLSNIYCQPSAVWVSTTYTSTSTRPRSRSWMDRLGPFVYLLAGCGIQEQAVAKQFIRVTQDIAVREWR